MSNSPCPSESSLWPPAIRGQSSPAIERHLADCAACRKRIDQIRAEREAVRAMAFSSALTSDDSGDSGRLPEIPGILQPANPSHCRDGTTVGDAQLPIAPLSSPGRAVGKYILVECLSRGGQGTVFRAWDPHLCRPVAIKLSHARIEEGCASLSRIQREGTLLAQIDHPHLARVFDAGLDDGYPYLVMEYVPGVNLREYMEHHRMTTKEMRRIILEISSAVAAAHRRGILHLDLKPDNVMIGLDGQCKLIDFGMAWLMMAGDDRERARIVAGTFSYMSPEQLSGKTETWSRTTDVFGLGGLLCFLLTGQPPLPRRLSAGSSEAELLRTHQRLLQRVRQRRLSTICRRALEHRQEARFPDADAFHRAVSARWQRKVAAAAGVLAGSLLLLRGAAELPITAPDAVARDFHSELPETAAVVARETSLELSIRTSNDQRPWVLLWKEDQGCIVVHAMRRGTNGEDAVWQLASRYGGLRLTQRDEFLAVVVVPRDANVALAKQELDKACRSLLAAGGLPETMQCVTLESGGEFSHSAAPVNSPRRIRRLYHDLASLEAPFTAHLLRWMPTTTAADRTIALALRPRTEIALGGE